MVTASKFAGCVILFEPTNSVIENISSYSSYLHQLFVIDNSSKSNSKIIKEIKFSNKNAHYHFYGENMGIARALNDAANMAQEMGYDYLFTFDQDSLATKCMIKKIINFVDSNDCSDVGIISPFHSYDNYNIPPTHNSFTEVTVVPTSGNLLNLNAYLCVGPFREQLFIDYVDIEYCLRLKSNGYKIFQINDAILLHKLGELKKKRFLLKYIAVTNHSAERMYYRVRNRFYVINKYKYKYPLYCLSVLKQTLGDVVKIIIYESNKIYKLKMMLLGSLHYITGKYGKIKF